MTQPEPSADEAQPSFASRARSPKFILSLLVAALLLAGAAVAIGRNREALHEATHAIAAAPLWIGFLALALPGLTWIGTTGSLWCLMQRVGRVGKGEMAALLGVAAVANYLPGRPGMFARIAYHKRVNDIAIGGSVRSVVWMTVLGVLALVLLLALAFTMAQWRSSAGATRVALTFLAPALAALASLALHRKIAPTGDSSWQFDLLALALAFRSFEMLTWSARYWVVFTLIGKPIAWEGAVALAAVSNISMAIPIAGNGLGLREWAIGLLAPVLPGALASADGGLASAEVGLLAELIHRGVEVLVTASIGLMSAFWLAHEQRRRTVR